MKRAQFRHSGKPALDLIEESTHLLRKNPALILAPYYIGTIPFILGFLYFWSEMSRNPFADRMLLPAALGMAVLLVWMKTWQAVFALRMRSHIAGEPAPVFSVVRCLRIVKAQVALQPSGLVFLPLSAALIVPFPWVHAYYQNILVLCDGRPDELSTLGSQARRHAALWPGQVFVTFALLSAFGIFVFVNWSLASMLMPHLVKILFGIETVFTRSGGSIVNPTFTIAMLCLTFLVIDPIFKVAYVLRCFYGEALTSGADLKSDLKQFASPARIGIGVAVVLLAAVAGVRGAELESPADTKPVSSAERAVVPSELDRAIDETINQRKYIWRRPQQEAGVEESGEGLSFLQELREWVRSAMDTVGEWIEKILKLLSGSDDKRSEFNIGFGGIATIRALFYLVIAAAIVALLYYAYRLWKDRHGKTGLVESVAIQPLPDVADENVAADQLPEDEWIRLARELLGRGELRLAMRAYYLATLAHLAERNLIGIARFKSNRDYELELCRRGHSLPGLPGIFGENVRVFEAIWYGMRDVNVESVQRFADNVRRIKEIGFNPPPTIA